MVTIKANVHPHGVTSGGLPTVTRETHADMDYEIIGECVGEALSKAIDEGFDPSSPNFTIIVQFR